MDAEEAKAKLLAVAEELGHEIRVFTNSAISTTPSEPSASYEEEPDDFYELTPEDYYRITSDRMGAKFQMLKTRKLREAEAEVQKAARRARVPKATIRVRFPDNYIFEAKFESSDKVQSLVDLLMKVVARPDLPFNLYTTPPKQLIKDTSKDFYSAGFAPGANIYFSYNLPKGSENTGPYLRDDILSLNGLTLPPKKVDNVNSEPEATVVKAPAASPEPRPAAKKPTKPKWLKL